MWGVIHTCGHVEPRYNVRKSWKLKWLDDHKSSSKDPPKLFFNFFLFYFLFGQLILEIAHAMGKRCIGIELKNDQYMAKGIRCALTSSDSIFTLFGFFRTEKLISTYIYDWLNVLSHFLMDSIYCSEFIWVVNLDTVVFWSGKFHIHSTHIYHWACKARKSRPIF